MCFTGKNKKKNGCGKNEHEIKRQTLLFDAFMISKKTKSCSVNHSFNLKLFILAISELPRQNDFPIKCKT